MGGLRPPRSAWVSQTQEQQDLNWDSTGLHTRYTTYKNEGMFLEQAIQKKGPSAAALAIAIAAGWRKRISSL